MNAISWLDFRQKASSEQKKILLAEGEDLRVIQAAYILKNKKIAIPWVVGSRVKIELLWKQVGGRQNELVVLDPQNLTDAEKKSFTSTWLGLPKNKKQTHEDALARIQDPLILGCLCLKTGRVDGFIGGATRTTADTLRAAFTVIGLAPDATTLFGFFLIEPRAPEGNGPLVLLADCAVIPEPSPKQLCNIAIGAAQAYEFFVGNKPRVAFLSFSTLGSAEHPQVDEVRQALRLAREKAPQIEFEGEWQADAALDRFTAGIKGVGNSSMAGQANVLIMPNLNTGNIAYKLVQRLGRVRAVGPVLWGMAQPANDLSRGCSADDIIDMAALTSLQAQYASARPALAHKEISS